jgi:hypothetical protein
MNFAERTGENGDAAATMRRTWQGAGAAVMNGSWRCLHCLLLAWFDRRRIRPVLLCSAALAAVTYCILLAAAPPEPVPEPFAFDSSASWITTAASHQATGCFRLDLNIPAKIVNAWITLATNGGFDVSVNSISCGRFINDSPTHAFQRRLSEAGQRLTSSDESISIVYPREYQWSAHDSAELPTWLDLTSVLHPGVNALCIEVETPGTTPALILSGEALLATGERIPIRSGPDWRAEAVPGGLPQERWTYAESPVLNWNHARTLPWKRNFWRLVPTGAFEEPFRGNRIRFAASGSSITSLEQEVELSGRPAEGFLRVATDTPFQIWINDRPVQPITRYSTTLGYGPWFLREVTRSELDFALGILPVWFDANEVATLLPGQQTASSASEQPRLNNFNPDQLQNGQLPGQPITTSTPAGGFNAPSTNISRTASPYANIATPDRVVPPVLTRNRRNVEFVAYSVTPLLREGKNTIRIGLYKDEPEGVGLSWEPFFAFDGGARLADGSDSFFASGQGIRSFSASAGDSNSDRPGARVDGPIEPSLLSEKQFFGYVYPDRPWFSVSIALFFVCTGTLLIASARVPRLASMLQRGQTAFAVLAAWVWAGMLLRSTMLERSEALFWRFPVVPLVLLIFGILGAVLAVGLQATKPNLAARKTLEQAPGRSAGTRARDWLWPVLVGLAVALCFALRAWQFDIQPPDEDEYVSIQASLAIAKTGVPAFLDDVWYTRSPAYHYLAGAFAALTGSNIYGLRILSVLLSCATAILVWKMARELTLNRFFAFCTLALFVIHPFLVFTGHAARFYQEQQFFHLLGVYFFLRGFVANTGMRDRYLAVLVFLLAVLSQEITVLEVLPLTICCILFAQRRPWPDEMRILVAAGCAVALIALDVLFYQAKCLTAVEGVSPRVEPRIGWCFERPSDFFAMLIGYSRLHLVLSVFLIPGFLVAWRRHKVAWVCLYTYLFLSVIVVNLLITSKAFRYEYYLIPLWLLLCVHGMAECAKLLVPAREQLPIRTALAFGWFALAICSWSPWRILPSYDQSLQANPTSALRFVAENLRAGDRIAITEVFPQAALIETGQCDYDLATPVRYDYVYRKHGALIDRNAGAQVIGNLDELQRAFAKNDRLWIVFSRQQLTDRALPIQWGFPGARVQLYLRNNARLVFRSYLWSVYLWDRNAGEYSSFREKPLNWFY